MTDVAWDEYCKTFEGARKDLQKHNDEVDRGLSEAIRGTVMRTKTKDQKILDLDAINCVLRETVDRQAKEIEERDLLIRGRDEELAQLRGNISSYNRRYTEVYEETKKIEARAQRAENIVLYMVENYFHIVTGNLKRPEK